MHVIKDYGVSFGESYEALFLRMQRQSQSFQFPLSFLFFSRDRFLGEYVDPVNYTSYFKIRIFSLRPWHFQSTRKLEERFVCFFPPSRKARRFLVDDQGQDKLTFFFGCDSYILADSSPTKDFENFPLIASGCFKAFPTLFKIFSSASTELNITLLSHCDIFNMN